MKEVPRLSSSLFALVDATFVEISSVQLSLPVVPKKDRHRQLDVLIK